MKVIRRVPLWALLIILLLLANLGWMSWNLYRHAEYVAILASYKNFKLEVLHTNDWSGIGRFEAKTEQPIWVEWSVDGKPMMENHYFQGHDVFDVTLSSNRPARYSVYYREPDKSITWWLDRGGNGSFTERIFYDTSGNFYKQEVWYDQSWQKVDRRNGTNGIIPNNHWFPLKRDANGVWTIDSTNYQSSRKDLKFIYAPLRIRIMRG
jgi:hypothetical protein